VYYKVVGLKYSVRQNTAGNDATDRLEKSVLNYRRQNSSQATINQSSAMVVTTRWMNKTPWTSENHQNAVL